jgi:hypothetical protein
MTLPGTTQAESLDLTARSSGRATSGGRCCAG